MSVLSSRLFHSQVYHRRSKPKQHRLSYKVFFTLFDLDELDTLHRRFRWFSVNSFNLFSFYDRDHGPGENRALRPWIEHQLAKAGRPEAAKRIEILCFPRILGYAFNPITVYYCYDARDHLSAVLYEVSNTFGERHNYLALINDGDSGLVRHSCEKRFYVSPFMDVTGHYHFSIKRPGDRIIVHIHQTDQDGPILDAWVRGKRGEINDRNLMACLTRYPLLTLKVIGGIHYEALKLWLKGIKTKQRPAPPAETVTVMRD